MKNFSLIVLIIITFFGCKKDAEVYTTQNTSATQTPVVDTTFLLSVYPNPCDSEANFKLTCPRASSIDISIVNLTGQIVYQNNGNILMNKGESTITLITQYLAQGVYFVMVKYDTGKVITKLIVAH